MPDAEAVLTFARRAVENGDGLVIETDKTVWHYPPGAFSGARLSGNCLALDMADVPVDSAVNILLSSIVNLWAEHGEGGERYVRFRSDSRPVQRFRGFGGNRARPRRRTPAEGGEGA